MAFSALHLCFLECKCSWKDPMGTLGNKFDYWHVLVAILLTISIVCYQSYVIPIGIISFFSKCYFVRKPQGSQHRPFWLERMSQMTTKLEASEFNSGTDLPGLLANLVGATEWRDLSRAGGQKLKKRSYGKKQLGWFLYIFIDFSLCDEISSPLFHSKWCHRPSHAFFAEFVLPNGLKLMETLCDFQQPGMIPIIKAAKK